MIAGALSVVVALALAGDPPDAAAVPQAAPPSVNAPSVNAPSGNAPSGSAPSGSAPSGGAPSGPAAPAAAPAPYVAVMRPATDDPLLQEVSSRIRSELAASGFESRFVDCGEPTETRIPCPGPEATASIALGRDDGIVELDVRAIMPDGLELSRHVRVLDRDGGQDPSVLAVRAVELLRDLRLNARRRPSPLPSSPAVDPEEPKIPAPPPPPPRWSLSTGIGVLASPALGEPGIAPALGARLAAGAVVSPRWATVLTFAGPFNSTFATAPTAQASLMQALGTLELRFRFPFRLVRPFVAALTGINYLRANVSSDSTNGLPRISTAWVPLFGAGGGLSYGLGERFSVGAEAEVFATVPDMLLEVDENGKNGVILGRAGAPSVLVTADVTLMLP
ncbi:MAG TPA: hypothetical protein VGP64_11835 [Polyangia bacterium]